MQKVRLSIKGLSYSERQTGAYALLLAEEGGQRKLPIVIGGFEAQSIAIALEKAVSPPRPLTHDLFKNVLQTFEVSISEVIIHRIKDGVFFASLITQANGKTEAIDARPSDAVALAIRFGCPIFTTEKVLQKAGMILEEDAETATAISVTDDEAEDEEVEAEISQSGKSDLQLASTEALLQLMEEALANEDYELAATIRDELEKRKKN